eukprot:1409545-Prymnesium_polylepis.1
MAGHGTAVAQYGTGEAARTAGHATADRGTACRGTSTRQATGVGWPGRCMVWWILWQQNMYGRALAASAQPAKAKYSIRESL